MKGPNPANAVYLHVVQDVINNVRGDFESEGVEEGVLEKLQKLWEAKLTESGAVRAPLSPTKPAGVHAGTDSPVIGSSTPGRFPGHDLNAPYQPSAQASAPSSGPLRYPTASQLRPPVDSRPAPYMARPAEWDAKPTTAPVSASPVSAYQTLPPPTQQQHQVQQPVQQQMQQPVQTVVQPTVVHHHFLPQQAQAQQPLPQQGIPVPHGHVSQNLHMGAPVPQGHVTAQGIPVFGAQVTPMQAAQPVHTVPVTQDFFSDRKRKRDDWPDAGAGAGAGDPSQGGRNFILPQTDGAADHDDDGTADVGPGTNAYSQGRTNTEDAGACSSASVTRGPSDSPRTQGVSAPMTTQSSVFLGGRKPVSSTAFCIPQMDGTQGDEDDEDDYEDDEAQDGTKPAGVSATSAAKIKDDGDDELLGADDDDDDDDDDNAGAAGGEEDVDEGNIVFATYEKVTRQKNRWKCVLRNGIMNLSGRDFLFYRANGEFEF